LTSIFGLKSFAAAFDLNFRVQKRRTKTHWVAGNLTVAWKTGALALTFLIAQRN
jgi:hypothetical protein